MKTRMLRWMTSALAVATLASCAGYELGGRKPRSLEGINGIAVPMFANNTQHPRAEAIATSAAAEAITRDGTFRVASVHQADAILEGTLTEIESTTLRGSRLDTLLAEEFRYMVTLNWRLIDARNPTKVLALGVSTGESQLFRDSNLQTARNNALNEALENAADSLVSRIADGF